MSQAPAPVPRPWEVHATGELITALECSQILGEHAIPPRSLAHGTWRQYQTRWRAAGKIPGPKAAPTRRLHLYDKGEVTWWAAHRPGRGARTDLRATQG